MLRTSPEDTPQPYQEVLNKLDQRLYDGTKPISASNDELILPDGLVLAIVDSQGRVIKYGPCLEAEVFQAVSTVIVDNFCCRFKGFTDDDFKREA